MIKKISKNIRNRVVILPKEEYICILYQIFIFLGLDVFNNFILQLKNINNKINLIFPASDIVTE